MNIIFSGHYQRKIYFPKSSCSFGSHSGKTALYLSLIFLFKKGGAFLHALPFKHSWWFYFQLKMFKLVADVLILLTEIEGIFFCYILNKEFLKLLLIIEP